MNERSKQGRWLTLVFLVVAAGCGETASSPKQDANPPQHDRDSSVADSSVADDAGADSSVPASVADDAGTDSSVPVVPDHCPDAQETYEAALANLKLGSQVPCLADVKDIPRDGLVRCADGSEHRVFAGVHDAPKLDLTVCPEPNEHECPSGCNEGVFGLCADQEWNGGGCGCAYACRCDADCPEGEACAGGRCAAKGSCSTQADCGEYACAVTHGYLKADPVRLECQTELSTCQTHSDCKEPTDCDRCEVEGEDWTCTNRCGD